MSGNLPSFAEALVEDALGGITIDRDHDVPLYGPEGRLTPEEREKAKAELRAKQAREAEKAPPK